MSKLAGPAYISNAARTEQNIKDELEAMRNVIAEVGGGYTASGAVAGGSATWTIQSITLDNNGASAVPASNVALIVGHANQNDTMITMASTGLVDGRIVYLKAESQTITVQAGSASSAGQIVLATNSSGSNENFVLNAGRTLVVMLRNTGSTAYWQEIGRSFGNDQSSERTWLGLGTASTFANGDSNLDAGKLGGVAAANYLTGSSSSINAATLDNIDSTGFVRINPSGGAEQSVLTPLSVKNSMDVDAASSTGAPALQYTLNGVARGKIISDGSVGSGSLTLLNTDSSGDLAGIKIDNESTNANKPIQYKIAGSAAWASLTPGAGNGLNADTVDGKHGTFLDNLTLISDLLVGVQGSTLGVDSSHTGHVVQRNTGALKFKYGDSSELLVQWGWMPKAFAPDWGIYGQTLTFLQAYSAAPWVLLNHSYGDILFSETAPAGGRSYYVTSTQLKTYVRGPGGNADAVFESAPWIAIGNPA